MTKHQLNAYRERLQGMGARIQAEVSGLRGEAERGTGSETSGNLSNTPLHLGDLSSETYEQEVATGLLQNEQEVLADIQAALDRLDAGTFGNCATCGKEIPQKRLEAVPYARCCMACAERAEQTIDR